MSLPEASQLLSIYAIYLGAAMVPGPNILVISGASLSGSRAEGVATALGVSLGTLLFSVTAFLGLAALLVALPSLANAIRYVGAAYLLYLAASAWTRALRGEAAHGPPPRTARTLRRAFVRGLLTNLSNSKSLLFYLSLMNFVVAPGPSLELGVLAVLGMVTLSVAWYGSVALAFSRPSMRAWYTRGARWIDAAIGTLFAAAGARLALGRLD